MTLQEILDKNYKHFITNGNKPSRTNDGKWATYYNPDKKTKDPIGLLMPPSILKKLKGDLLLRSIRDLIDDVPEVAKLFEGISVRALESLQNVHDLNSKRPLDEFRKNFRRKLLDMARKNNLKYNDKLYLDKVASMRECQKKRWPAKIK